MVFVRQEYLDHINASLSQVANELEGATALQFTDANITAEDFFVGLLNRTLGYDFVNSNILQANMPGIDLADNSQKVSGQVTTDKTLKKVQKTLKVFGDKDLDKEYQRLIMVYPSMTKPKRRSASVKGCPSGFDFDATRDIISFRDLLATCRSMETDDLRSLDDWLSCEVRIGHPRLRPTSDQTVLRIISLIEYLTDQEPTSPLPQAIDIPDPDGKFEYFDAYRGYLESQYQDHVSSYHPVSTAKKTIGYDGVRARKIGAFLKQRSRALLVSCSYDAKEAFEALVSDLEEQASSNRSRYENSAIRYFLACEMIACNVFPKDVLR